jgi:peroxiredoxin
VSEEQLQKLTLEDRRAIIKIIELQQKILETLTQINEDKALENFERWVKANKVVIACPSLSSLICEYSIQQHTKNRGDLKDE